MSEENQKRLGARHDEFRHAGTYTIRLHRCPRGAATRTPTGRVEEFPHRRSSRQRAFFVSFPPFQLVPLPLSIYLNTIYTLTIELPLIRRYDTSHAGLVSRISAGWPTNTPRPRTKPPGATPSNPVVQCFRKCASVVEKYCSVFEDGVLDHDMEESGFMSTRFINCGRRQELRRSYRKWV